MFVPLHCLVCTNLSRCLHFAFSSNKTLQSRGHRLHIISNRQLDELHVIIIAKYTKHASKREERRGEGRRGKKKRKRKKVIHNCCNCAATLVPHPLAGRFWRLYPWGPWIKVKSGPLLHEQDECTTQSNQGQRNDLHASQLRNELKERLWKAKMHRPPHSRWGLTSAKRKRKQLIDRRQPLE